jgi:hypothetical protein
VTAVDVSGPIVGAGLLRQVVSAAYGRCVCAGQCGRTHKKDMGRCPREDTPAAPLHAVPREAAPPVAEMRLGVGDLLALCDDCHRGLITRRSQANRKASAAALASGQGGLF